MLQLHLKASALQKLHGYDEKNSLYRVMDNSLVLAPLGVKELRQVGESDLTHSIDGGDIRSQAKRMNRVGE